MNYHQYYPVDVVNGPGTRCTLFVAGCEHRCKGCYNVTTWPVNSGHPFDQTMEDRVIADLQDTRIRRQGLSLSGGDPLHPANIPSILKLVTRVKACCPDKDIWCWTGYIFEDLTPEQQEVVCLIDTLIDGPFVEAKKQTKNPWYGSSNQRIFDQEACASLGCISV